MTATERETLELDHPGLSAACLELTQARTMKTKYEKIEDEQRAIIRGILEEFPDTKKFELLTHTIAMAKNTYHKQAAFLDYLVKAEIDPEIIQAATAAARAEGEPKLLVQVKK